MHAAEHQAPSSTLLRASAACNLPSFEDCLTQAGCCLYKWGLPPPGVPALAEILKENCPLRVGDGGAPTRRKMVGRLEGAAQHEDQGCSLVWGPSGGRKATRPAVLAVGHEQQGGLGCYIATSGRSGPVAPKFSVEAERCQRGGLRSAINTFCAARVWRYTIGAGRKCTEHNARKKPHSKHTIFIVHLLLPEAALSGGMKEGAGGCPKHSNPMSPH
eukprot:scaffold141706_cov18-Tisochrysis_lutea.AAC.3